MNLVPCAPSHFCPASDATQPVDVEPNVLTYASPFLPIAFRWVGPIYCQGPVSVFSHQTIASSYSAATGSAFARRAPPGPTV